MLFNLPASPFADSYDQFGIPVAQSYDQFSPPAAPDYGTAPFGSPLFAHPQTTLPRMTTTDPAFHQAAAGQANARAAQNYNDWQDFDGDVDDAPLPTVSSTSFNVADAIFTALGLINPAFGLLSPLFTAMRGYNYFFGDDEADTQNMTPFGIDPEGLFTGIGGRTGADDTSDNPDVSSGANAAANAAAAAVGFDVDDTEMAAEMTTDDTPGGDPGGGDPGGAPGDPGGGVGADGEASGDPDSDSGDDPGGPGGDDDGSDPDDGSSDDGDDDYALGGLLPGSGSKDIRAHGGEYIIRMSAVKKYGRGLFDDLNESKIGKRQLKGLLDA